MGRTLTSITSARWIYRFPPVKEQEEIAAGLKGAIENIDTTMDRARRQIELTGEYRTRLIADVVTGKIDVREANHE